MAFIALNAATANAQFSGSVTLSGFRTQSADLSTTVAGRDTTTPDKVFNPAIDLIYNWNLGAPSAIKFEANIAPNWYTTVKARSFLKNTYSATGEFYLSDIDEKPAAPPASNHLSAQATPGQKKDTILKSASITKSDSLTGPIKLIPPQPDKAHLAAEKLTALSELLDSFEVDKKGLSEDALDVASELKDSVSESILALGDILSTQVFTESIADVVSTELTNQKKIFSQVPMLPEQLSQIEREFAALATLLDRALPQSDILPVPKPKVEVQSVPSTAVQADSHATPGSAKDLIAQAIAHLEEEESAASAEKPQDSPIITLVNSQTACDEISSQDILPKEDLAPHTSKTLASLLSIPVSLETQSNTGAYKIYSYSTFEVKPRLDLYNGPRFGLGITQDLSITKFPNDTSHLSDGTENLTRLDGRIELTPAFVFAPELALGFKSYDRAISYNTLVPVKGHPLKPDTVKVTTPTSYQHILFGGSLTCFPLKTLAIGYGQALTRSSALRPYLTDSAVALRSKVAGAANDDSYSYELTRETIFAYWRIFWDLNITADFSYENRKYADVEVPRKNVRQNIKVIGRTDSGPLIGFDLSKQFAFDSRLVSIFETLTPTLDIQSVNYKSTIAQYKYKDLTVTVSVELAF